ncbi:MAG: aminotransferase class V-fold PLP-dependent enzyme [Candidatus Scalindua sp.]|nr:aminotransferase class V-fold PLP-dependent enzyme [Candidatus Scalindua sp.]MDV5166338.1 aminotransferase class V-fold PLP-dependent enzyme [Candidatus Scalindua sp.]
MTILQPGKDTKEQLQCNMKDEIIYLDNASTSFPKPETVYSETDTFLRNCGVNIGRGENRLEHEAAEKVLESRRRIARFFGIKDYRRLVFTYNATLALNLALKGGLKESDHLLVGPMQHNSVMRPLHALKERVTTSELRHNAKGLLDLNSLEEQITPQTKMVVINHASNVNGVIQPLSAIGRICREKELLLLVDASQSAGSIPIDIEECNIDLLAFTGHKGLLGPLGVGGLFVGERILLEPIIEGGTGFASEQERQPRNLPEGFEAGTRNTPAIIGLAEGISFIEEIGLPAISSHKSALIDRLKAGLEEVEDAEIYHSDSGCGESCGVLSFTVEGWKIEDIGKVLNSRDFVVRGGLQCAPHAHRALNTFPEGTIRVSPGYFSTEQDIDSFLQSVKEITVSKMYQT